MTTKEPAASAASESDDANPGLVRVERENAIVQCVFGRVLPKLPTGDYPLSVVAELPHGQGKQTVLEGPASAFLRLATWSGVEGILTKDANLIATNKRIHRVLGEQGVKVEVEPVRQDELPEGAGEPSMVLWGPEVARLIRGREPFRSGLLGTKRRVPLAAVLEEAEKGGVLFYYGRSYSVLKTLELGPIELSFSRPVAKRAMVIAVDLDENEAERLTLWAKYSKLTKEELIRVLLRGLPKTTRGGRVAIASGVFSEIPVKQREHIDRLVRQWEKQSREAASALGTAAAREARRSKQFLRAIAEIGRGRIDQAVARLEAAVKDG